MTGAASSSTRRPRAAPACSPAWCRSPTPPQPRPREHLLRSGRRLWADPEVRRVLGFFTAWNFAIGLPAPFWTLYMLRELEMSFFLISLHTAVVLVVRLACTGFWARMIERVGSQRCLIYCGLCISIIPVLWMVPTPDRYWPIWCEAVLSGVIWTGFNQAAFIQPMAVMPRPMRSVGIAWFNFATGAALCVASLLGGVVLRAVGAEERIGFFILFGVSALLRAGTSMYALRLHEPGMSVRGFVVNFIGYGVLRRPSVGRQWIITEELPALPPAEEHAGEGDTSRPAR